MEFLKKIYILLILFLPLVANSQKLQDIKDGYNLRAFNKNGTSKQNSVIYFQQDTLQNNADCGRIILNISTVNQEDIELSYQLLTAKASKEKWYCRLEYRLSEEDSWKEIKDKHGNKVEFVSQRKRYSKNFAVSLPSECQNKDFVQLSWHIDSYSKSKKNYPQILLHNIVLSSEFDKYFGAIAKVKVFLATDNQKKDLKRIDFDKIQLPFVYPASTRIGIQAENIRDSIVLSLEGENASYFSLSQTSISDKQSSYKTISLTYHPKKEGKHKANLRITTKKLDRLINIPIEGFCAKQVDYHENLLPQNTMKTNSFSYHIPVFSITDYQYKFSQTNDSLQPIYILYTWYRDNDILFSMHDTASKQEYCVPLKSPQGATALDIKIKAKNDISFKDYYFGSPKVKTMVHSGSWADANNWTPKGQPGIEDFVVIDKNVRALVDKDAACSMLILNDSSNVIINNSKMFYVANNIFYNKNAWFTVHQYLLPLTWNYICSPINQAAAAIFSMKNDAKDNVSWLMQYNTGKKSKHDDYWSEYITDPKFTLTPARGYAVYTHNAMNVKYEGLLCNSGVTITLVCSEEDRWNMIGNPYTAPLSSKKLFEDIDGKIQGNTILLFDHQSKVYNPLIIDTKQEVMIPSLESFFVEALDRPTDITFKRSHQYIPKTSEQIWHNENYLNLSVRKGSYMQYILLGMDPLSTYNFDQYDCHKMFGNNEDMPDIYVTDSEDEYSVCVFPDYPAIYDIGLYIGSKQDVEINLNNLSIMPEYVMILVEDKTTKEFYNFCSEGQIKLSLNSGTTENYRLHILKAIEIDTTINSGVYIWKDKDIILFFNEGLYKITDFQIKQNNQVLYSFDTPSNQVLTQELPKGKYTIVFKADGKMQYININL